MTEGLRYRITWKHPKARRRRFAEGVYEGQSGQRAAFKLRLRDGRLLYVNTAHDVRWHSLVASL